MIVTDLKYHLEKKLVGKLDLMIDICKIRDALLIIDGAEGEGKTNGSLAIAYYIKHKMNRDIYMYFRLEPLIKLAKETEGKIIIWDEPALDSLSTDWYREVNKNLLRMLMTCRKKKHFFIINMVKFYKFSEYVVVDRAKGMVHIFARRHIQPGRFFYIRKDFIEGLYNDYRFKKQRNYRKHCSFGGQFPIVDKYMDKMNITISDVPNCTQEKYEELKDKAIDSIGQRKKETNEWFKKYNDLKILIGKLKCPITSKDALAKQLGLSGRTILRWSKIGGKNAEVLPP